MHVKSILTNIYCKLCDKINDFICNIPDGEYLRGNVNFAVAAKTIVQEAMKETYESEWIPVRKRLPNHEEYVENDSRFIVTDGNRRYQSLFDIYSRRFVFPKHLHGFSYDLIEDKNVVAWHKMPERYDPSETHDDTDATDARTDACISTGWYRDSLPEDKTICLCIDKYKKAPFLAQMRYPDPLKITGKYFLSLEDLDGKEDFHDSVVAADNILKWKPANLEDSDRIELVATIEERLSTTMRRYFGC